MKIVVTGSIAYDYLMSFPGKFTEHILPEHLHRISLSFLVDTMDKRRGGCGPNIAYTLALLRERPLLMATAGEDFGEFRVVAGHVIDPLGGAGGERAGRVLVGRNDEIGQAPQRFEFVRSKTFGRILALGGGALFLRNRIMHVLCDLG